MAPLKRKRQSTTCIKTRAQKLSCTESFSEFDNLPEEVILLIFSFLKIDDVARVSTTCSRLHDIVSRASAPWKKGFADHNHSKSEVLAAISSLKQPPFSTEKQIFLLHKKVERYWARSIFARELSVADSRPAFKNFSLGHNVVALFRPDLVHFHITAWSPISKKKSNLIWSAPAIKDHEYYVFLSVIVFDDDVIAVHLSVSDVSRVIFGLDIGGGEVVDLWHNEVPGPVRMHVERVGDVLVKIFQHEEIKDYWTMDLIDYKNGQVLKQFRLIFHA